jgi:hypothetical protein
MIIELPNYLSKDDTAFIRESVKPLLQFQKQNTFNRDGKTVNITKTPELNEIDNLLSKLFSNLHSNTILHRYRPPPQCSSGDSGYEYHLYSPGDICHFHSDYEFHDGAEETLIRYASVVLHLNTVNEGGELIFPAQDKKIKTEEGKVVIFPPYGMFSHYTTPSEEAREVIVTWFVYTNYLIKRK